MCFFQNLHKICTKIMPDFWGFDSIPKKLFAQNLNRIIFYVVKIAILTIIKHILAIVCKK